MLILLIIPPTANHNIHKWVGHLTGADEIIHHHQMTLEHRVPSTQTLEQRQATSLFCQNNFLWLARLEIQEIK